MYSRFLLALAVAILAAPVSAQTFTLPEIGLQSSGSCPQFAVRDRASNDMVPLGCLDALTKTWKLTPGQVDMRGANEFRPSPRIYSGTNVPTEVAAGRVGLANATLFSPTWSFLYSGGSDFGNSTQVAAQGLIRCTTASDYKVYESCMNIDFYSRDGYVAKWRPNTTYAVGFKVVNGYDVFEATTAGTSAGSGGPAGKGSSVADGSVVWKYDGDHFTSAKAAWSLTAWAFAKSGKIWGMNPNIIFDNGFRDEGYGMEIGIGNFSGHDAELVNQQYPGIEGIWLGGYYQNTSLAGMSVGGFPNEQNKPFTHFEFWCKNAKSAGKSCVEDWSNSESGFHTFSFAQKTYDIWAQSSSEIGLYANGANRTAGVLAENAGPVGLMVRGSQTFAAVNDVSNSPISLSIQGAHSSGAIIDNSTSSSGYRSPGSYSYSVLNLQEAQGAGATYGVTLKEGQRICFTGQDGCFGRAGGKLYYSAGGVNQFAIEESTGSLRIRGQVVPNVTP